MHAALVAVCALTIVPFAWMFSTSLKSASEIFDFRLWPAAPTFDNYTYMWQAIPMAAMLATTGLNAVCLMIGQGVLAIMAAYAFGGGSAAIRRCF